MFYVLCCLLSVVCSQGVNLLVLKLRLMMFQSKKPLYFALFSVVFLSLLSLIGNYSKLGSSTFSGASSGTTGDVLTPTPQIEVKIQQGGDKTFSSDSTGKLVKVVKVIDGDTIKVETGEVVRLIGIDAPETVHPSKSLACFGKEASQKTKETLEGNLVRLEKDVSDKDKYGRLLRYVWKEGILINELLVREGYATVATYPPDVKYQDRFLEAQRLAREENKGLWAECAGGKNSEEVKGVHSAKDQSGYSGTGSYICDCSKTCAKIGTCEEAQYQLEVCGCKARDADGDGIACDSLCQ